MGLLELVILGIFLLLLPEIIASVIAVMVIVVFLIGLTIGWGRLSRESRRGS